MPRLTSKQITAAINASDVPQHGRKIAAGLEHLYLFVRPGRAAQWLYQRNKGGKQVAKMLGDASALTIEQASQARDAFLRNGTASMASGASNVIPMHGPAVASHESFADMAAKYIADQQSRWTPAECKRRTVYACAELPYADKPWIEITAADIATAVLETLRVKHGKRKGKPVWINNQDKPGALYRSMTEGVIGMAAVRAGVNHANPALWSTMRHLLPNPERKAKHHGDDCTPYAELPGLLREVNDPMATLISLTAVRVGDVIGDTKQDDKPVMDWSHVDLKARIWTIPCTKSDSGLRVPLTDQMIACLGKPSHNGGPVFGDGVIPRRHYKNLHRKVLTADASSGDGSSGGLRLRLERPRLGPRLP